MTIKSKLSLLAIILLIFFGTFYFSLQTKLKNDDLVMINKMLPAIKLQSLQDDSYVELPLQNKKNFYLINIWASWCVPCRQEHPLLMRLKKGGMKTKSGIMLGLGESETEVYEAIDDLSSVGCDILTLGQYLQPTPNHLPIAEFVTPQKFDEYREYALTKGFRYVESGPLVRSSYHAEKHLF